MSDGAPPRPPVLFTTPVTILKILTLEDTGGVQPLRKEGVERTLRHEASGARRRGWGGTQRRKGGSDTGWAQPQEGKDRGRATAALRAPLPAAQAALGAAEATSHSRAPPPLTCRWVMFLSMFMGDVTQF